MKQKVMAVLLVIGVLLGIIFNFELTLLLNGYSPINYSVEDTYEYSFEMNERDYKAGKIVRVAMEQNQFNCIEMCQSTHGYWKVIGEGQASTSINRSSWISWVEPIFENGSPNFRAHKLWIVEKANTPYTFNFSKLPEGVVAILGENEHFYTIKILNDEEVGFREAYHLEIDDYIVSDSE